MFYALPRAFAHGLLSALPLSLACVLHEAFNAVVSRTTLKPLSFFTAVSGQNPNVTAELNAFHQQALGGVVAFFRVLGLEAFLTDADAAILAIDASFAQRPETRPLVNFNHRGAAHVGDRLIGFRFSAALFHRCVSVAGVSHLEGSVLTAQGMGRFVSHTYRSIAGIAHAPFPLSYRRYMAAKAHGPKPLPLVDVEPTSRELAEWLETAVGLVALRDPQTGQRAADIIVEGLLRVLDPITASLAQLPLHGPRLPTPPAQLGPLALADIRSVADKIGDPELLKLLDAYSRLVSTPLGETSKPSTNV